MVRKLDDTQKQFIKAAKETKNYYSAIVGEYQYRLRTSDDEATIILVGHLCIENLLNKIIQSKCKSPKIILDDPRSYTFSVKLQIIYSMGLMPDDTYKNIIRINKFRNKFAHNIDFDIDENSMSANYNGEIISFIESMPEYRKKKNKARKYLELLCQIALTDLGSQLQEIGVEI